MTLFKVTALLGLALYASTSLAQPVAEDDKRWELGIGLGGITAPDYRGSKTNRSYIAPIPYVVYRGPIIRTDRDGVRGEFFTTDRLEFTASMAVSVTPDSDKNALREGMPSLASTLEAGPALNINLTGDSFREGLSATLPARAVITVGRGSPEFIGVVVAPSLVYRHKMTGNWLWNLRAGPVFASGEYHNYYYSVEPEYALPERPRFDASSGYNGFNAQFAVTRRHGSFWYAFYGRYSNLQGTDFRHSPLVETEHNYSGGFAISWVIH
ncbi:MAG TPA: MipA/OmpV family protein [Cellvibrionaceae bacterium]